jgi:hypothetical protein
MMAGDATRGTAAIMDAWITYSHAAAIRLEGQHAFRGLSTQRHIFGSYWVTRDFGPQIARIFGVGNEIQGLLRFDIPNLSARLSGRQPWAFELQDLVDNEKGISLGKQAGLSCKQ